MALGSTRADIPALAEIVHLNSGGISPTPHVVTDELLRIPQYVAAHGPALLLAGDESLSHSEAAHQVLAESLGVDSDEIAFTMQFSTAASLVFEGLAWRAGDEVIITDQEHPAMVIPLLNIARRRQVVIRRLAVSHDRAAMLADYRALLGPRTRLVAVSHVTTENGIILPVEEISRLARQHGALVLYDGAQSYGQFPIDLRALDCDFYIVVGYKWMFGPRPSAAIYIRQAVLDQVEVTWTGSHATIGGGIDMETLEWVPSARRFEFGGRPWSYEAGMAVGVRYVLDLGLVAIAQHAQALSGYLHERLTTVPGARLHSPTDLRQATGINTVSIDGLDGGTIATALRERWQILTRPALRGTSIRVSVAAFTDQRDLDRLIEALTALATGR